MKKLNLITLWSTYFFVTAYLIVGERNFFWQKIWGYSFMLYVAYTAYALSLQYNLIVRYMSAAISGTCLAVVLVDVVNILANLRVQYDSVAFPFIVIALVSAEVLLLHYFDTHAKPLDK
jgi:hypothetical protein